MSADSPRDLSGKQKDLRVITAERLEAIVEAAERAAEGVIDDAEAQARRYLAQAREEADRHSAERVGELSELVDSLLGQTVTLRHEAERLQATLEEAKSRLEGNEDWLQPAGSQDPPDSPQSEAPRLHAVGESEEHDVDEDARRADASGARLLATQLAVSGSSREEIELQLRNGFKIEDTDAILDAILGPED